MKASVAMSPILFLVLVCAGCWPAPPGPVLHVKADATGGGTGADWANALTDLQDALRLAADYGTVTEIWVAEGTYRVAPADGNRETSFRLLSHVGLYGGFAGTETERDPRDPAARVTVLSGDLNGDDEGFANNTENSYHVVIANNVDASAVLDGFTIRGGNATEDANPNGGGIFLQESGPTISRCRLEGNTAKVNGGAWCNYNSSPTLAECVFNGNTAGGSGGALLNLNSHPVLTACTFTGNASGDGGAVLNRDGSHPSFAGCTFEQNVASSSGGAVANNGGTPVFADCSFTDNTAGNGGAVVSFSVSIPAFENCTFAGNVAQVDGGAVLNIANTLATLAGCVLRDNTAGRSGGGLMNSAGSNATLMNCSFLGNAALASGGGIFNFASTPLLFNCVFSGNSSSVGGAILNNNGSDARIVNCTFNRNQATLGAAIYNNLTSSPVVLNSILWGNVDVSGADAESQIRTETGTPAVSFSCVQGGWTGAGGAGNIAVDPAWVDRAGPDGEAGTGDENLRLDPSSPCVDAGDNASVPADTLDLDGDADTSEPVPLDRDNQPRFVDAPGTPDTGSGVPPVVDMGAYELPS